MTKKRKKQIQKQKRNLIQNEAGEDQRRENMKQKKMIP